MQWPASVAPAALKTPISIIIKGKISIKKGRPKNSLVIFVVHWCVRRVSDGVHGVSQSHISKCVCSLAADPLNWRKHKESWVCAREEWRGMRKVCVEFWEAAPRPTQESPRGMRPPRAARGRGRARSRSIHRSVTPAGNFIDRPSTTEM